MFGTTATGQAGAESPIFLSALQPVGVSIAVRRTIDVDIVVSDPTAGALVGTPGRTASSAILYTEELRTASNALIGTINEELAPQ